MLTDLPNLLTLSRIGAIPILVALFYIDGDWVRWVACALFTAACLTDYFDGYVARARRQVSPFGRFLDPIADKLLVAAVLFMLVAFDRISGLTLLPGLVILCREITVSGLREFLADLRVGMPVSRLAKWKTGIQMTAIGFLIVGDGGPDAVPVTLIGEIGLWVAAILTIITGYDYLRSGLVHMTARRRNEPPVRTPRPPANTEQKPVPAGRRAARL
jgi:cardiolipin synthase